MRTIRHLLHLVVRFVGSLLPRRVRPADDAWVAGLLSPGELALWRTMPRADRVESVGVARRVGRAGVRPVAVAAALVHDVGKQQSGLGTFGRAVATAVGAGAPRWIARRSGGFATQCTRYLDHAALGADALRAADARPELVGWAAAHHDAAAWPTVGLQLDECAALARADGEV